jgi:[NiFe] hydrogenase diaphorase moiety large subunit
VSGPSGELIPASGKDRLLAGADIRCGGSVMIFGAHRDLFTILLNFSRFFTHESCGLCTPCRAGNPQLLGLLEKLNRGHASAADLDKMRQWAAIIRHSSRCGLGQTAPRSLEQALDQFPRLFEEKLTRQALFNPDFDLEQATHAYDQLTREK